MTDTTTRQPLSVRLLVRSRRLAWRAGALIAGGAAGNHQATELLAQPLAGWMAEAASDDDLWLRMDAARQWIDVTADLMDHGAEPPENGDSAAAAAAGIYAWVTAVPGYGQAQPGAAAPPAPAGLTGRDVFIIRCLLEQATEDGGSAVDALVSGAVLYATLAKPPVTAAEVLTVIGKVYLGDPRQPAPEGDPGAARFMTGAGTVVVTGAPRCAGAAAPAGPGGTPAAQPEADSAGPFGPGGTGPVAEGPMP